MFSSSHREFQHERSTNQHDPSRAITVLKCQIISYILFSAERKLFLQEDYCTRDQQALHASGCTSALLSV